MNSSLNTNTEKNEFGPVAGGWSLMLRVWWRFIRLKFVNLSTTRKRYLLFILPFIGVLLVTVFTFLQHQNQQAQLVHLERQDNLNLVVELREMRDQLHEIASGTQSSPELQPLLAKLSTEMADMEKNMTDVAKSADIQKMAVQLDEHLSHVEKAVSASGQAKQYVDAKNLPFQVVAIDVIAQQPFVSIDYDHRVTPLGVGDSLAGWKVVRADYGAFEVEFENNQGQTIRITAAGKSNRGDDV